MRWKIQRIVEGMQTTGKTALLKMINLNMFMHAAAGLYCWHRICYKFNIGPLFRLFTLKCRDNEDIIPIKAA